MRSIATLFISLTVAFGISLLALSASAAQHGLMPYRVAAARSCSDQNAVCISSCMAYGIGHGRRQNPQPKSAVFCHNHCARWYAGCLTNGCWNADLVNVCDLIKQ